MLASFLTLLILSSAVINEKEKSIIYCRMSIQGLLLTSFILYNNFFIKSLEKGIGIYGGMFNVNIFTQSFNLFIIIIVSIILILTSFNRTSLYSVTVRNLLNIDLLPLRGVKSTYEYKPTKTSNNILVNMVLDVVNKSVKKLGQLEIIEYALIIVFILCGTILLMSTVDLISMFLSIELQSYGLYILSTIYRDSESATNSGLTYFLLGGMSSCFILLGSGLLYVNSGTTNIENIFILNSIGDLNINFLYSQYATELVTYKGLVSDMYIPDYISISLVIIIVGFFFKISAAPFHFWSPDVYDGIPTIVTTFVAIVPKISIFVFILQLIVNTNLMVEDHITSYFDNYEYIVNPLSIEQYYIPKWRDIITVSSLMSLIIGSLLGLTQYRIKRLFAYSTISHIGFILLALSVNTIESIQGYIFYIMQYTISNVNAFFILVAIGFVIGCNYAPRPRNSTLIDTDINKSNSPVQLISQLQGYFYVNSYISISLAITLFSFVGIPPLIGFFAKQMVLSAALHEGYLFITLVAVVTSVIAAVYYLNIIKNMFFFNNNELIFSSYLPVYSSKDLGINKEQIEINNNIKSKHYSEKHTAIPTYVDYTCKSKVNSALTTIIALLTMTILTFIFWPNEWLRVASILSITIFKL